MNGTVASKLILNALSCRPGAATSPAPSPLRGESPLRSELEGDSILPSGKVLYKGVTKADEEIRDEKGQRKPRLNVQEVLKKYGLYVKMASVLPLLIFRNPKVLAKV